MSRLLLVLCLICFTSIAFGQGAIVDGPFDPSAARKDLSNVSGADSLTLSGKIRAAWADILGDVYASGSAKVGAGNETAPAYAFFSDSDTGMYSGGANDLRFSLGSKKIISMFRSDTGGVFALTGGENDYPVEMQYEQLPNDYLQIGIEGATASMRMTGTLAHTPYIGAYSNRDLTFHTNNLYRGMLSKDGNVLINSNVDDGVNKLQVSGNIKAGRLFLDAGTAAAPAYSFSSDPNTGIYSPGADTIGFGVGGTENARFVGGKLLIATSTDAGAYPLQNNGYLWSYGFDLPRDTRIGWAAKDDIFTLNGVDTVQNGFTFGPTAGDYVTSAGYFGLNFATQGVERARITSGGNVLIATSTDDGANKLQVNGSMRLVGGAAPTAIEGAIYFNSTDKHLYVYNGTGWVQLDN